MVVYRRQLRLSSGASELDLPKLHGDWSLTRLLLLRIVVDVDPVMIWDPDCRGSIVMNQRRCNLVYTRFMELLTAFGTSCVHCPRTLLQYVQHLVKSGPPTLHLPADLDEHTTYAQLHRLCRRLHWAWFDYEHVDAAGSALPMPERRVMLSEILKRCPDDDGHVIASGHAIGVGDVGSSSPILAADDEASATAAAPTTVRNETAETLQPVAKRRPASSGAAPAARRSMNPMQPTLERVYSLREAVVKAEQSIMDAHMQLMNTYMSGSANLRQDLRTVEEKLGELHQPGHPSGATSAVDATSATPKQ
jgi:hypothetical protein